MPGAESRLSAGAARPVRAAFRRRNYLALKRGHRILKAGIVRIHRISIRNYKGLDVELPVSSAVVLFGPNDSGKTNVLEAVMTTLGVLESAREEPGWRDERRELYLSLLVELDRIEIDGDPDQERFLSWTTPGPDEGPAGDGPESEDEAKRHAEVPCLVHARRSRHGDAGLRSRWFRISQPGQDGGPPSWASRVEWLCPSPLLPYGWQDADAIIDVSIFGVVVSGAVRLGTGDVALAALRDRVERFMERLAEYACRDYYDEDSFTYVDEPPDEPWLALEGDAVVRSPVIVAACEDLSARATGIAPDFLRLTYRLVVDPLPANEWRKYGDRRIVFRLERRTDGTLFDIDVVSRGVQAWAACALAEAMREAEDEFAARFQWSTELARRPATLLYVFDEPEAHLHPLAQEEAAKWVRDRASCGTPIILASHALPFLSLPMENVEYVKLGRSQDGITTAERITGDVLGAVDEPARALGVPPTALIQLTRAWLVVEGEHDRKVLELYHGRALRQARIQILPLSGAERAEYSFLNLEALGNLGIPFVCLLDNVLAPLVSEDAVIDRPRTREERIADKLRRVRDTEGVDLEVYGLPYPDIICALPIEAVRRVAAPHDPTSRSMPSWAAYITAHGQQQTKQKRSIKTYVKSKLGLTNLSDDDFIDELFMAAEDCAPDDRELGRIVESVVAHIGGGLEVPASWSGDE